jgi:hypothetical protein
LGLHPNSAPRHLKMALRTLRHRLKEDVGQAREYAVLRQQRVGSGLAGSRKCVCVGGGGRVQGG